MRIAIVINTAWNIYNFRAGLIKFLQKKGCEVIAIAPTDNYVEPLKAFGVDFYHLPIEAKGTNPVTDFISVFKIVAVYKKVKPDIILHYTVKPNIYGTFAAKILGIPCISNVSGLGFLFIDKTIASTIGKWLYKLAFYFPKKVFFQNNEDETLFIKNGLVNKKITEVLPGSGINLDTYKPVEKTKTDSFVFLVIARLLINKGLREYAEAAYLLKKKYPDKKMEFWLIGFKESDPKIGIPEVELNEWQKNGSIIYLGHSDNVKEFISKADCMVLPSYREGTSRTLLESIAMGKPIVTTNVPGCKEVVIEAENGFLCEAKNSNSLLLALEKTLLLPSETLHLLGKKSRAIAESKYDENIVFEKYWNAITKK
jgi:glycosyltransferase involved in cell wall biosynthesis